MPRGPAAHLEAAKRHDAAEKWHAVAAGYHRIAADGNQSASSKPAAVSDDLAKQPGINLQIRKDLRDFPACALPPVNINTVMPVGLCQGPPDQFGAVRHIFHVAAALPTEQA